MSPARTLDANLDPSRIRLLTKIARMYHERGLRQPEIAQRLHISQASVSRLLKKATEVGIIRTVVVTPEGVYADLEERVEQAFGLEDVVVVDTDSDNSDAAVMRALGAAAAVYLEETLTGGDRIGISSWSSTLLAMVDAMRPRSRKVADEVVQVLGGLGAVGAQATATRLTGRLAQLTGARAVYVPAPGLVSSPATRQALVSDPAIATVEDAWEQLSLLLVGIGSLEPSFLLRQSGNAIAAEDSQVLRREGAVGDVCLRFFDSAGDHISTLDDRVIGIGVDTMRRIPFRPVRRHPSSDPWWLGECPDHGSTHGSTIGRGVAGEHTLNWSATASRYRITRRPAQGLRLIRHSGCGAQGIGGAGVTAPRSRRQRWSSSSAGLVRRGMAGGVPARRCRLRW